MKIKLILHIICAILFGVCAIIETSMISSTLYTIATIMWSICIGIDIMRIKYDD